MSANAQHPAAETLDAFVDLTALGYGIIALAMGRDAAVPGSEAVAAYERGLAKLRAQVRDVAASLPTAPCASEGEFAMRAACLEWVESVAQREALEKVNSVATPTPLKGPYSVQ